MKRSAVLVMAAAALFVFVARVRAQSPAAAAANAKAAPGVAAKDSSHPSISGVWFMRGSMVPAIVPQQDAPMLPYAVEKQKASRQQIDPELHCFPPGVPRIWVIPAPFEIIQLPDRVLIYHEFQHLVRQIHLNREHPTGADLIATWMGDSTGRWEGDTLVIDTVGFNDKTRLDVAGLPHSDALHTIERLSLASPNVLQLDLTIEDPKAYSKPMTAHRIYDRKPGWEIGEWICEENNTYIGVNTPVTPEK